MLREREIERQQKFWNAASFTADVVAIDGQTSFDIVVDGGTQTTSPSCSVGLEWQYLYNA
eukprot:6458877-Amphidinium_carterae.1